MLMTFAVGYTISQEKVAIIPTQEVGSSVTVQVGDTTRLSQVAASKTSTLSKFIPVTHWSIGIKGGLNYFRILPEPISRIDQIHPMIGGTVEYSINPLVGIGLEYNYNPYGRPYYINETASGNIKGGAHDAILYGSINLTNLLTPYRMGSSSKLNVFGDAGVGYSFYNFSLDGAPTTYNEGPIAKIGLNLEYNLSKSLALGIEGQYRFYHIALLCLTNYDKGEALTTTIGLRYKFDANGSKQHARNISIDEYYPKPALVIIEKEKAKKDSTTEILNRLKALEAENAALNDKINKLNDAVLALSSKEQTSGKTSIQKTVLNNASFQNIEFEFGSYKLSTSSYSILDQIADILKNNQTSVKLIASGFTDYIGTKEFNQTLSVKRANAVKVYLLDKGVPASNISVIGYGKEKPIATNKTETGRQKNRRVEFQIIK